jgi:SAM-dependent methyltransferase
VFAEQGKKVSAVDLGRSDYFKEHAESVEFIECDYTQADIPRQFDLVWASHVLEHQPNAQLFLKKLIANCREGGVLAITVPPLKYEIVGGHVSLWNAGLLLYHLVLAGIDCREARVLQYLYNISVIVTKRTIAEMPLLTFDKGDIHLLNAYFPQGLDEPFDGNIKRLNWP